MGSNQSTMDFIADQVSGAGEIRSKKMFGEYALYCDEKVVAFVCDDQLYVKPTEAGEKFLKLAEHGAPPYPGSKNYLLVPEEKLEDREWLNDFIRETAKVLPLPKPKIKKEKKRKA